MPSLFSISLVKGAGFRRLLMWLLCLGLGVSGFSLANPPPGQPGPSGIESGPQLGVLVRELPLDRLATLGLDYGVQVVRVFPETPAAKAGLLPQDIIISVEAKPVYSIAKLRWLIERTPHQGSLELSLLRENERKSLRIEVAATNPPITERDGNRSLPSQAYLGIGIQPLTDELRETFQVPRNQGVLVSDVVPGSPAKEAGIRAGDVILKIDRRRISSKADVYRALNFFDPGDSLRVELMRDARPLQLQVELGRVPEPPWTDKDRNLAPWNGPQSTPYHPHSERWYRGMDQMLDHWQDMWDEFIEGFPSRGTTERVRGEI